ncbi:MAG: hypothetical protein KatS3mg082_1441 [Nitrospiraceae bacterium]|nr:MAG: hypothetical protein KatS3mg082_1441 [Nitrospiraceae bacterium]
MRRRYDPRAWATKSAWVAIVVVVLIPLTIGLWPVFIVVSAPAVYTDDAQIVSAPFTGVVAAVRVADGQPVSAGDTLFILDTSLVAVEYRRVRNELVTAEAAARSARAALARARADAARDRVRANADSAIAAAKVVAEARAFSGDTWLAAEARAVLTEAQAELEAAERDLQLTKRLYDIGVATAADVQNATIRYHHAHARYMAAEVRLARLKADRPDLFVAPAAAQAAGAAAMAPATIQAADAAVRVAEAAVAEADAKAARLREEAARLSAALERATVVAPVSGVAAALFADTQAGQPVVPGRQVGFGEPLISIIPDRPATVLITAPAGVDQAFIGDIRVRLPDGEVVEGRIVRTAAYVGRYGRAIEAEVTKRASAGTPCTAQAVLLRAPLAIAFLRASLLSVPDWQVAIR